MLIFFYLGEMSVVNRTEMLILLKHVIYSINSNLKGADNPAVVFSRTEYRYIDVLIKYQTSVHIIKWPFSSWFYERNRLFFMWNDVLVSYCSLIWMEVILFNKWHHLVLIVSPWIKWNQNGIVAKFVISTNTESKLFCFV